MFTYQQSKLISVLIISDANWNFCLPAVLTTVTVDKVIMLIEMLIVFTLLKFF